MGKVPLLKCDHVKADTHLFFHSKHAAQTYSAILLSISDSDVYVIDLCHAAKISAALCSEFGKCYDLLAYNKDSRMTFKINPARQSYKLTYVLFTGLKEKEIINLTSISESIDNTTITEGLLGFHIFTGVAVDTISAFVRKGKKKPFLLFLDKIHFQQAFQCLDLGFWLPDALFDTLEQFVCFVYGQPDDGVNQARCRLFCMKALSEFRLPPCRNALLLHCKRANYQAAIWRKAWLGKIDVPLPHGHGWVLENNALSPRLTTQEEAPPKLMQNYSCKCKKNQCANIINAPVLLTEMNSMREMNSMS